MKARHLNIQWQPEKSPKLDDALVRRIVEALAEDRDMVAGFESSSGDDEGQYVNFTFLAKDLGALWARVRADVLAHAEAGPGLSRSTIVICEGPHGWDDYLLLHHYDRSLELDQLEEN